MMSDNSHIQKDNYYKDIIDKYLNSALLVALITGCSYVIGYSYSSAYFNRMGIDISSIDLPTTSYLITSLPIVIIAGLVSLFSWYKIDNTSQSILIHIRKNTIMVIITAIIIYQSIIEKSLFLLLLDVIMVPCLFAIIYNKWNFSDFYESLGFSSKVAYTIIALFLIIIITLFYGEQKARSKIEGSGRIKSFINIKTKVNIPDIDYKTELILIIHNDKKYYLTKQAKPAPLNPKIYVIPDDQVEYVVLTNSVE